MYLNYFKLKATKFAELNLNETAASKFVFALARSFEIVITIQATAWLEIILHVNYSEAGLGEVRLIHMNHPRPSVQKS